MSNKFGTFLLTWRKWPDNNNNVKIRVHLVTDIWPTHNFRFCTPCSSLWNCFSTNDNFSFQFSMAIHKMWHGKHLVQQSHPHEHRTKQSKTDLSSCHSSFWQRRRKCTHHKEQLQTMNTMLETGPCPSQIQVIMMDGCPSEPQWNRTLWEHWGNVQCATNVKHVQLCSKANLDWLILKICQCQQLFLLEELKASVQLNHKPHIV